MIPAIPVDPERRRQVASALRAVLLGGWADTLVTDAATARWLVAAPPPTTAAGAGRRA
mgnify:CR=1 FL=1